MNFWPPGFPNYPWKALPWLCCPHIHLQVLHNFPHTIGSQSWYQWNYVDNTKNFPTVSSSTRSWDSPPASPSYLCSSTLSTPQLASPLPTSHSMPTICEASTLHLIYVGLVLRVAIAVIFAFTSYFALFVSESYVGWPRWLTQEVKDMRVR